MSPQTADQPPFQSKIRHKINEMETFLGEINAFDSVSNSFLETLKTDNLPLGDFTKEYQKILAVIRRGRNKCSLLRDRALNLETEILQQEHIAIDTAKLMTDAETLKNLKTRIHRAEALHLSSAKREDSLKDNLRQIRQDVANLTATIRQGVGLSSQQEKAINELIAFKEQTAKDVEAETEKIINLRTGLSAVSDSIEKMELERKQITKDIAVIREKNGAKKVEIDFELSNKEKTERELREVRVLVTIKSQEAITKQNNVTRLIEEIGGIDHQIKNQRIMIEKLVRDQEFLAIRTVKLQQDHDAQLHYTNDLTGHNGIAIEELRTKERELSKHRAEVKKMTKTRDVFVKKIRILEEKKAQEEAIRKVYRQKNDKLAEAIEHKKKQVDVLKRSIDDLNREEDILKESLKKTQAESVRLSNYIVLQKQQETNIQLETARLVKEAAENEKRIKLIKQERDELQKETVVLTAQSVEYLAQLKTQELQIFEYKRQSVQFENKLKYQQNLYEAVQSDRKLHSKQLIESQLEIVEMKRKLKIMNFQINGYKEEVNAKNATLAREIDGLQKLSHEGHVIKDQIKQFKSQNELAQAYIKTQIVEEFKLDQFVKEAEIERERQQSALDAILDEKDSLNSQLLLRNQELVQVYGKIKTQNLDLARGEAHYRSKLSEIQSLRELGLKLRVEAAELSIETESLSPMKHHTVKLQKQISIAKSRIKALEQELVNPINVHRWRKLEGSEPKTFAMVQLLHTLQRKLISKSKEEAEKENAIKERERLFLHLKSIIAKQPGPEVHLQIQEFHKIVKDKKQQLRHMETELDMYKAQVEEYRHSILVLDSQLADCKKSFLKLYQKRVREQVYGKDSDNDNQTASVEQFEDVSKEEEEEEDVSKEEEDVSKEEEEEDVSKEEDASKEEEEEAEEEEEEGRHEPGEDVEG